MRQLSGERRTDDEVPEPDVHGDERHGVQQIAMVAGGLGCFALGVAAVVVAHTGRFDRVLVVSSTVVAALAGGVVAYFTRRLTRVTEEQHRTSGAQGLRLDETVSTLGALRRAMDTQASAMQALADATLANTDISRREWAARFPPELVLLGAYLILPDGGSPEIRFGLENRGHSEARITAAYLMDVIDTGMLPQIGPATGGENDLKDAILRPGVRGEFRYLCRAITASEMGPAPTFEAMLGGMLGSPPDDAPAIGPLFIFWGAVSYETEGQKPEQFRFRANCRPPNRHFTVEA